MNHKQRGVTMIGWIFLLIPVAIVLYAAIRLTPVYLNFYKISQAMKEVASQLSTEEALAQRNITAALERRFDTGYVDNLDADEVVITKSQEGGWKMQADYEVTVPLIANVQLLVTFDETVEIN